MFQLAYRQLRLEAVRTLLTSFALGAVFAVILVLGGFELGQYAQLQKAVLDRGADLIVAQAGVSNMIAVRSTLPQLSRRHVEAVDGVSSAHPLTALPAPTVSPFPENYENHSTVPHSDARYIGSCRGASSANAV